MSHRCRLGWVGGNRDRILSVTQIANTLPDVDLQRFWFLMKVLCVCELLMFLCGVALLFMSSDAAVWVFHALIVSLLTGVEVANN